MYTHDAGVKLMHVFVLDRKIQRNMLRFGGIFNNYSRFSVEYELFKAFI